MYLIQYNFEPGKSHCYIHMQGKVEVFNSVISHVHQKFEERASPSYISSAVKDWSMIPILIYIHSVKCWTRGFILLYLSVEGWTRVTILLYPTYSKTRIVTLLSPPTVKVELELPPYYILHSVKLRARGSTLLYHSYSRTLNQGQYPVISHI